jgi:hypothetical protein
MTEMNMLLCSVLYSNKLVCRHLCHSDDLQEQENKSRVKETSEIYLGNLTKLIQVFPNPPQFFFVCLQDEKISKKEDCVLV